MEINNILVFRLSSLGDVALTVPVLNAVLEQNPKVHLSMVCPRFMHGLFPTHDRLKLIDFDKNGKHQGFVGLVKFLFSLDLNQYDAIADLHGVLRTQIITKFSNRKIKYIQQIDKNRKQRRALIAGRIDTPLKHTTEKYADVFRKLGCEVKLDHQLKNHLSEINNSNKKGIGVAPFAKHEGKRYPLSKMKELVFHLAKNHKVYIFGSVAEMKSISDWFEENNILNCQNMILKDELNVIATLKLMISMDSANMHFASLVGVPVVSVWGVTHPNAGFLGYGQSEDWVVQDNDITWRPTSIYGNKLGPMDNPNGFANIGNEEILEKVQYVLNTYYA